MALKTRAYLKGDINQLNFSQFLGLKFSSYSFYSAEFTFRGKQRGLGSLRRKLTFDSGKFRP